MRLHRRLFAWLQQEDDKVLVGFAQILQSPDDQRLIEAAFRSQLRLQLREYPVNLQVLDAAVRENPRFRLVFPSRV